MLCVKILLNIFLGSVLRIRIRSDAVLFGHPDPDPEFLYRIRGSGSGFEKNWTRSATLLRIIVCYRQLKVKEKDSF